MLGSLEIKNYTKFQNRKSKVMIGIPVFFYVIKKKHDIDDNYMIVVKNTQQQKLVDEQNSPPLVILESSENLGGLLKTKLISIKIRTPLISSLKSLVNISKLVCRP